MFEFSVWSGTSHFKNYETIQCLKIWVEHLVFSLFSLAWCQKYQLVLVLGLDWFHSSKLGFWVGRERERSVTVKKIYEYIIIRGNITTFTKCFSSVSLVNAYSACSELLACSLLVREEVLLAGLCEGKILFLAGNSVHVNSAHMRGLASTSQPAAPAEQAYWFWDTIIWVHDY